MYIFPLPTKLPDTVLPQVEDLRLPCHFKNYWKIYVAFFTFFVHDGKEPHKYCFILCMNGTVNGTDGAFAILTWAFPDTPCYKRVIIYFKSTSLCDHTEQCDWAIAETQIVLTTIQFATNASAQFSHNSRCLVSTVI